MIRVRWGHSVLTVPFSDSTQAWSVGVDWRPKCWAMANMAMNLRVFTEIICEPLSETASRIGVSSSSPSNCRFRPRASARSKGVSNGLCKWRVSNLKEIDCEHDR